MNEDLNLPDIIDIVDNLEQEKKELQEEVERLQNEIESLKKDLKLARLNQDGDVIEILSFIKHNPDVRIAVNQETAMLQSSRGKVTEFATSKTYFLSSSMTGGRLRIKLD